MDNVVINITEIPNQISFQITEDTDNVTINVTEGYFTCSDLNGCQVITDLQNDLSAHVSDNGNPHNVTASQVGLGNVDNTSDANKPVSTAQQTALNLKEDKSNKVTSFTSPNNTDYATTQATINLVDNRVQSNIKIIGDWDATSGLMPLDDESNTTPFITQWGSTIKVGWAFRVGYGQAGTVGGFDYEEGDVVYALIDNAGPTPADWGDLDHNLQQANESLRGTAKVITAAVISDETTTDDEKFVTGKKLWLNFWTRVLAIAHTFSAKITFTTAPRFSSGNPDTVPYLDSNKDLVSSSVTPTQLSYLDATSPIQTQIDSKLTKNNLTDIVTLCTITGWAPGYTANIDRYDLGDAYHVSGRVTGTASGTSTNIILPNTNNGHYLINTHVARNNGTLFGTAVSILQAGSATILFYTNLSSGTYSSVGTKEVNFSLIIKK